MSDILVATLGGLWAMLAWGVSDWFAAKSSKKFGFLEANLAIQLPGLIIWSLVLLLTGQTLPSASHSLILTLAGVTFTFAYLSFVKALEKGHLGIVVPLGNTFPIITIILTVLFLTSTFSGSQYLAMFVIVAGVVLLAFEKNIEKIPLRILHRETAFALTAALLWGLGNFIQNIVIGKENWISIVTMINLSMAVSALLLTLLVNKSAISNMINNFSINRIGLIAGATLSLGSLGFYIGSDRAKSVIIPSVIASASPLVASFLAAVFDREKLTLVKRAGAVIVVAGIIMLNI